jgi:hypothetical protein
MQELNIANIELTFQNDEEKRAEELTILLSELAFKMMRKHSWRKEKTQ